MSKQMEVLNEAIKRGDLWEKKYEDLKKELDEMEINKTTSTTI